ncbi:MAG: PIG-L family deacetylase [Candidatus Levybacteria bacterium]|nr:PIG-L family deacetylase [Candidatus Levybacteria bacterium]
MFLLKNQTLLVIAPHPDDEVIGCGGLIKKIKDSGGKVYVLFLTVGDTKDFSKKGSSSMKKRKNEIDSVANYLQFDSYYLAFEGNDYHLKLDLVGQKKLMDIIERESPVSIEKVKPTIVAFPFPLSYNQDHRIAAFATHAALRTASKGDKHFVSNVLSYEQPADEWTLQSKNQPNFFVPLTNPQINAKIKALKLYKSQLRSFPNPRSIEAVKALAILRGSQSSHLFAESFTVYRTII